MYFEFIKKMRETAGVKERKTFSDTKVSNSSDSIKMIDDLIEVDQITQITHRKPKYVKS